MSRRASSLRYLSTIKFFLLRLLAGWLWIAESKLEKNVFSSLVAKATPAGIMTISKTRRHVILLIGTIFIGTAPHLADGLGRLVQGISRITEETANRALVRHGQLISSPSPR